MWYSSPISPFHTVIDAQYNPGGRMKRERRQPTRAGWERITSKRSVVRRSRLRAKLIAPVSERKGKRVCTTLWPIRRSRNRS